MGLASPSDAKSKLLRKDLVETMMPEFQSDD